MTTKRDSAWGGGGGGGFVENMRLPLMGCGKSVCNELIYLLGVFHLLIEDARVKLLRTICL